MRPATLRIGSLVAVVGLTALPHALGQAPPRPLPASITGASATPTPAVAPASGVTQSPAAVAAPMARFQNLQEFPPETVQSLFAMRAGAAWLSRMNQANGRFFPGLNPGVRMPLAGGRELRQALAALALAQAAQFTGEETFTAQATQAVLALMSLTRTEGTARVPTVAAERCEPAGFAATVALAVYHLPKPDARRLAEADALCAFVRQRCGPDGAIQLDAKSNADERNLTPGLVVRALATSNRLKPDAGTRETLVRVMSHYRGVFKARPNALLAAALVPGAVDYCLHNNNDATAAATAFELADWLCGCQYSRVEPHSPGWIGGFRPSPSGDSEPGSESALYAEALACAAKLRRHVPDLAQYRKYRQAAVDGLAFARGLQFSDGNTDHFEKGFRARFLTGAAHLSPTDGTVRIDATAYLILAHLAFLQSGAEGRPD
jgi:hypothetical protein